MAHGSEEPPNADLVTADRGKERQIAQLGQERGLTVERRTDVPSPLNRSYAILSLPGR